MPRFRPRLRFSLSTLLALVTLLCVWLGLRIRVDRVERERDAVLSWISERNLNGDAGKSHIAEPIRDDSKFRFCGE